MKHIKDLTKEQLLEIAGLLFTWIDEAIDEPETIYSDGMTDYGYGETPDDQGESQRISFDFISNNKNVTIICYIIPNLSCDVEMHYTDSPFPSIDRLPTRNQYKIQKLFRKWKIEPKFK